MNLDTGDPLSIYASEIDFSHNEYTINHGQDSINKGAGCCYVEVTEIFFWLNE